VPLNPGYKRTLTKIGKVLIHVVLVLPRLCSVTFESACHAGGPACEASVLPFIHQSSIAMDEIESALASGRTEVAHTDPVSVPGWTGVGYVILDPDTGAGPIRSPAARMAGS
jgi:hypothetical protein